ncbi:MAG: glutaredoxin domain-containing protein [Methylobacter sp.]|nr:glutaredoxin domain-containing protein [Methylobacter sp.]
MIINQPLILLFVLTFALPAQASIWFDADGNTHYIGSETDNPASLENPTGLEAKSLQPTFPNNKNKAAAPQVDLYVTNWCPYCKKAITFLQKNNIAFNTYDIEQDIDAATRKKTLDPGYSGIPLAVINGAVIRGFSDAAYQQALAK